MQVGAISWVPLLDGTGGVWPAEVLDPFYLPPGVPLTLHHLGALNARDREVGTAILLLLQGGMY
jgi:hypothetical protein